MIYSIVRIYLFNLEVKVFPKSKTNLIPGWWGHWRAQCAEAADYSNSPDPSSHPGADVYRHSATSTSTSRDPSDGDASNDVCANTSRHRRWSGSIEVKSHFDAAVVEVHRRPVAVRPRCFDVPCMQQVVQKYESFQVAQRSTSGSQFVFVIKCSLEILLIFSAK